MSESFESLKSEIIAHLKELEKKESSKELKKAIDYFTNSESLVTCLEKSENGTWVEKAGYGVGTVRIWKGKKYKKVSTSPVKWVRVFDKNDRGAATSIGKYIAQVKACKTIEELYQFCMKQRSLFQDDNGVDLPIMDKLRAEIEDRKGKIERGEIKNTEESKTDKPANKSIMNIINEPESASDSELKEALNVLQSQLGISEELVRQEDASYVNKKVVKEYPGYIKKIETEIKNRENKKNETENKTEKKVAQSYWIQDSKLESNNITSEDAVYIAENLINGTPKGLEITLKDVEHKLEMSTEERFSEKYKREIENLKNSKRLVSQLSSRDSLSKEEKNELVKELELIKKLAKDSKNSPTKKLINVKLPEIINTLKESNKESEIKKDGAKPTITFDRNGRLGEKAVNTKLGTDNIKALDALPEKFFDGRRDIMKYPSEVEIDGEKKFAYTNGQFLVVTHDIPANGVKTKQSEKIEGNYPNVEKVIPKEFKDNSAPKVDINIDQVMKDLPKVDFSKKAFNDDSQKQYMKIGNFWYDAKMVKATYDMLKGNNAEVLESKDTYSNGRFGRLCIKTDKGYSVIVSLSNDYADNYKKQSIYNSDEGSMSANAKAEYESRKKTGLPDTYVNNAIEFGYQIDNKGFIHGEDKNITFKGKGDNTEFYYNGIPTGIKNRSSYMYGTKEDIQTRIDAAKQKIEENIESYKEGKKNPANKPANYDATFPNMTDKDLTDIYKWWSNPKNIEEAIYKNSYKTKVPGLGSYGNDARKIGVVEDRVMDMLPDIKKEIARRGITIKKSLDGELIFESSLESYVKKSISILKKSLIG